MDNSIPEAKPNLTPMTDVVFLLLVFFLVSMKFKTLDMKLEAELPKNAGLAPTRVLVDDTVKLVARLDRPEGDTARLRLDGRDLGRTDDPAAWERLDALARATRARHTANGGDPADVQAEVDAAPLVATGTVVRAVDAFVAADIAAVRFTGTPQPR